MAPLVSVWPARRVVSTMPAPGAGMQQPVEPHSGKGSCPKSMTGDKRFSINEL